MSGCFHQARPFIVRNLTFWRKIQLAGRYRQSLAFVGPEPIAKLTLVARSRLSYQ